MRRSEEAFGTKIKLPESGCRFSPKSHEVVARATVAALGLARRNCRTFSMRSNIAGMKRNS